MLPSHLIHLLRNARDKHNGLVIEADLDDGIREPLLKAGCITHFPGGDPPGWYITITGEEQLDRAGVPTLYDGVRP